MARQRPGERDSLLLAARELARSRLQGRHLDKSQHPVDDTPDLGLVPRNIRRPKATFSATVMCGNRA